MSRIIVSILAYNAEPFIKYCLDSIYDFADMIIIVEGSFDRQRIYGLRSCDRTVELIKKYPDPKTKIRLFHMNRQEHEHRNVALRYCNDGDWYFTVDADEIYKAKDIKRLKKLLQSDAKSDMMKMYWHNFYFNFRLYLKELSPPRIFRTRPGCRFIRRNTMITASGIPYEKLNCRILSGKTVTIYHYGYIYNIRKKMALYGKPANEWYENIFCKFNWKNRHAVYKINARRSKEAPGIHYHGGQKLKIFKGKHPQIMKGHPLAKRDLIREFQKGYEEPPYRINPFTFLLRYLLYGIILK